MEQHWSADHAAMLDASLAGLRAGLKLTPDQDKLWPPFESAIRDATKLRMDQMAAMMDHARGGMPPQTPDADHKDMSQKDIGQSAPVVSPVDRLNALAQHMSNEGAALKKVVDAAKPLYDSLDDSQKRLFSMLGGDMLLAPHGHHGMGMMREGGMGMMGHDRMRGPEPSHDEDDEDDNED
jgi:hypothetical protein